MDDKYKFWQYLMPSVVSKYGMGVIRTIHNKNKLTFKNINRSIRTGSEPQAVFLLDRGRQKKYMLNNGYTIDDSNNYGLINKAVGDRRLPIYRTPGLDYDNDGHMNVIGNIYVKNNTDGWLATEGGVKHGGSYPTALYYNDKDNYFYQRGWDLNDYGKDNNKQRKGTYFDYDNFEKALANTLDFVGNPMVISTGYRKTPYNVDNITLAPYEVYDDYGFTTLQRKFDKWLRTYKNSSMINPYTESNMIYEPSYYYNYVLDKDGNITYDSTGMPILDRNKPKKTHHDKVIVNTTQIPEVVVKRKRKSLGGIY